MLISLRFFSVDFFKPYELLEHLSFHEPNSSIVYSVPISIERGAFTVPPGEPYTPFERMFVLFQDDVWIAIFATLLIWFISIQIINYCPKKVRDFVYGQGVTTPSLNLASNFLSGGQNKVPGRNFARFLLILVSVWCLIIRTCYQSELFKCLQQDIRKPRISSLQGLIDNNFTWYHPFGPNYNLVDDPLHKT